VEHKKSAAPLFLAARTFFTPSVALRPATRPTRHLPQGGDLGSGHRLHLSQPPRPCGATPPRRGIGGLGGSIVSCL